MLMFLPSGSSRISHPIHQLATNPRWQYRFHSFFTLFWIVAMIATPYFPAFRHNPAALIITEISLWANAFTHYGAMSGALAGIIAERQKPLPVEEEHYA